MATRVKYYKDLKPGDTVHWVWKSQDTCPVWWTVQEDLSWNIKDTKSKSCWNSDDGPHTPTLDDEISADYTVMRDGEAIKLGDAMDDWGSFDAYLTKRLFNHLVK